MQTTEIIDVGVTVFSTEGRLQSKPEDDDRVLGTLEVGIKKPMGVLQHYVRITLDEFYARSPLNARVNGTDVAVRTGSLQASRQSQCV